MPRDPNGSTLGTFGADILWGRALVLGDGSYDNSSDMDSAFTFFALRGGGGNDLIFGDIYYDGTDGTEGDQLYGDAGNDTIYGDCGPDEPGWQTTYNASSDQIWGGTGNDWLYGQHGNDQIDGGADHDLIVGGLGSDALRGASGNDTIWADLQWASWSTGWYNTAFGGDGDDRIYGAIGVDEMYGDNGHDLLSGMGGNDDLEGGNGRDTISGGAGDDRLDGGGYYATIDSGDRLVGDAGNDTVIGGGGDDLMFGGAGNDALDGGVGNDLFDGGTGADSYACGAGNDIYVLDQAGDTFRWEYSDSGTDLVRSGINWTLGTYHENLTLIGTTAWQGIGNAGANVIGGNAIGNALAGLGGNDTILAANGTDRLDGGAGNDRLHGDTGDDMLIGGAGADRLRGGTETDWFVFTSRYDSTYGAAGRDVIEDFSRAEADKIDLRRIDANAALAGDQRFTFIGNAGFSGAAGQLRVEVIGTTRLISGDINGDRVADFGILVDDPVTLTALDFYL